MSAVMTDPRYDKAIAGMDASSALRKRVAIIGGGFAEHSGAHGPQHTDAEVILIDRRNHHIFQPFG